MMRRGCSRRATRQAVAAAFVAAGLAVTVGALPATAQTTPWLHEAMTDIHSAAASDRGERLEVRCKGTAIEVALYVATAELDPAVQGRASAIFGLILDGSDQVLWLETKLLASGATTSVGVGGRAADQLARLIAAATRSIAATVMTAAPAPGIPQYNRADYPIAGANEAIRAAYAGCGIKF